MLFVEIIVPVFIVIFSGFVLEKTGKLDFRTLTCSSLYLFSPALVFSALLKGDVQLSLARDLTLFMILYTVALLLLSEGCGHLMRMGKETRSAFSLTTAMMNVGNFGLPLTYFAFGEEGLNASIMTFVLFTIPLGTLAIVLAQGTGVSFRSAVANAMRIPIFHAVILAMVFKALSIELPSFLLRPVDLLGQAAIPVMLVLLGMQLARTEFNSSPGFIGLSALLRLVIAPAIAWGLASLIGMEGITRKVAILQTSTPSAVLPLLYSLRFGTRPDLVAGAILATTLLSAATLTVVLYLLN